MTVDRSTAFPALRIEGVSHAFGKRAVLDRVGLTVERGQFCALLGPNGAGKTTLFSLITRLHDNASGSIAVFGHDVRRQSSRALQSLGVVFQARTVDLDLSVMQNLVYHAALHGMARSQAIERGTEELRRIGLADRAGDKVRALSGGQVRRLEIARSLLHRPQLLLLDEATVGLDMGTRQSILDHVRHLVHRDGLGVLWATHLIDEVSDQDQVYILHRGRVVAGGSAGSIARTAGAPDLAGAFAALTGDPRPAADIAVAP